MNENSKQTLPTLPDGRQVAAFVHIFLTTDGQVLTSVACPDRTTFNGIFETAKQDILAKFAVAEKQRSEQRIEMPPPGMQVPRNN